MGRLADELQARLRERLAKRLPDDDWEVERRIGGTPVDVVGEGPDRLVAVELEWRRADPADNTAKLFRHLAEESIDVGRVDVVQVFSAYYDLASGGVSSKRANAAFVGSAAARALEGFAYHPVDLRIDPPRGGGSFDDGWTDPMEDATTRMSRLLRDSSSPVDD